MKRKIIIIAVVLVLLAAAAAGGVKLMKDKSETELIPLSQAVVTKDAVGVNLYAHRGFSASEPENTLQAVAAAGEAGFYACEFDIHYTADGQWVVMHDGDIERTTNGKGEISKMTYAEISQYYIDGGNGIEKYAQGSVAIPTIEQVLDTLADYETLPEIEVKGATNEGLDELVEILNSRGIAKDVIIIGFDEEKLEYLRSKSDELTLLLLASELSDEVIENSAAVGFTGIAFNGNKKDNYEFIDEARAAGLKLTAWTIDESATVQKLYDMGITDITTNKIYP